MAIVIGTLACLPLGTLPSFAETLPDSAQAQESALTEATVSNIIDQTAESGSSTVENGASQADAITGPATSTVDLTTVVQSSTNTDTSQSPQVSQTLYTINDQQGDIIIDPSVSVEPTTPTSALTAVTSVQNVVSITNQVAITTTTGDARIEHATQGGNAISGDSTINVNVTNIISSTVNVQSSWVGVVTIYGSLQGNLVLPIAQAASTAPSLTSSEPSIDTSNSLSINNDTTLQATSGNATATNNGTTAGTVTGDATTSLTTYDIIHTSASAGNAWLIAVNVFGTWNGRILQAPTGTTLLYVAGPTGTQNTSNGSGAMQSGSYTILNSISAIATSGDATLSDNYEVGKAVTGSAIVNARLVNIISSHYAAGGQFGILVVNVYGSWIGSIVEPTQPDNNDPTPPPNDPSIQLPSGQTTIQRQYFRIIKRKVTGATVASATPSAQQAALGSTVYPTQQLPSTQESGFNWLWLALICLGLLLIAIRYYHYKKMPG